MGNLRPISRPSGQEIVYCRASTGTISAEWIQLLTVTRFTLCFLIDFFVITVDEPLVQPLM